MEAVVERENMLNAFRQVVSNKGGPPEWAPWALTG